MREMHPIDERFKQLFDAEATPPEEVREAIGHQLGWNKSTVGGSSFATTLLLLIGAAGAAVAVYNWTVPNIVPNGKGLAQNEITVTPETAVGSEVAKYAPTSETTDPVVANTIETLVIEPATTERSPNSSKTTSNSTSTQASAQTVTPTTSEQLTSNELVDDTGVPTRKPTLNKTDPNTINNTTQNSTLIIAESNNTSVSDARSTNTVPNASATTPAFIETSATTFAGSGSPSRIVTPTTDNLDIPRRSEEISIPATDAVNTTWVGAIIGMDILELRETPLNFSSSEKFPYRCIRELEYVQHKADWWIGGYAGLNSVTGKWTGEDAEALDRSETWKSGWQAGLMTGMTWRSGFSLGAGVGIARLHSTFNHEQATIAGETIVIDTSWTSMDYPGSPTNISTWSIDTTVTAIPGPVERTTANNQYSALQVPLSVWWHTDIKRIKLGVTAGVMGWLPMKQHGTTLARTGTDGSLMPVDVTDSRTAQRFGLQVHGNAGLSIGYIVTEHLSLFVEPMVSLPIYTGQENTSLSLTRPTMQVRLQYDLPTRVKRTK